MPRASREENRLTEDEIARIKLGPRGVPGGQDTAENDTATGKEHSQDGRFRRPYRLMVRRRGRRQDV